MYIFEKTKVQFEKGYLTNLGQEHSYHDSPSKPYDHHCPALPYQHPSVHRLTCLVRQLTMEWECKHCTNKAVITTKKELIDFNKFKGTVEDIDADCRLAITNQ